METSSQSKKVKENSLLTPDELKLNKYTQELVNRYEAIVKLIPAENNDRQTAASQSYQIQVFTTGIIETAEGLLTMTRQLKERWLLGRSVDELTAVAEEGKAEEDAKVVGQWVKEKIGEGGVEVEA